MSDSSDFPIHLPFSGPDGPGLHEPAEKVRLRRAVDLVSAIPHLIGFRPADGDIVIVFTRHQRVLCAAACQITDIDDLAEDLGMAAAMVTATEPGIDGAVLIAYHGPDADAVLRDLPRDGTPPLKDVLRVHSGRVWSLMCPHPGRCCPADGTVIPTDAPECAALFAVIEGTGNLPDRAGLGDCLRPGPALLLAQVETHLRALDSTAASARVDRPTRTPAEWFAVLVHEHDLRVDGPVTLGSRRAALLLFALQHVDVRDACLSWNDDAAWWLWLELIRHAPPGWVAPVATLIATTAFQQHRTTQARIAAEHALTDNPRYSLAALLLELIHRGIPAQVFTEQVAEARDRGYILTAPPAHQSRDPRPADEPSMDNNPLD